MSAQNGLDVPLGPASGRAIDRARYRVIALIRSPNPIWIRELKQSARLGRTPVILMVIAIVMTLVIASLGGVMSDKSSDQVGVTVYQTYFSIAFFLVTWVGPGVAANSIASEREGRTLEAVMLTGLSPESIARGKFLAAMTFISTYIVMLAPVGALAFLFGGVTATEVLLAFFYLFLFALLFVALGLAISSKMSSLRGSILVTLLLSVPLSLMCFGFLGYGLSGGIHQLWPQVPKERPVWIPTAYVRGELGRIYVYLLVVLPAVLFAIPTWFLYESTVANLKSSSEDRSTRLRIWFGGSVVALGACGIAGAFISTGNAILPTALIALAALAFFLALSAMVFAGEPLTASRRVRAGWAKSRRGAVVRFLGPSIINASLLQLALGGVVLGAVAIPCAILVRESSSFIAHEADGFVAVASYTAAFYVFVVGFAAWVRVRFDRPFLTRVVLVAAVAGALVVPWVVAAIAGMFTPQAEEGLFIAAPSPFYAVYMLANASDMQRYPSTVSAGWIAMGSWAVLGLLLFASAAVRCARLVSASEAASRETDRHLADEDRALVTIEASSDEPDGDPAT